MGLHVPSVNTLSGALATTRAIAVSVAHSLAAPPSGVTAQEIFSLCCCGGSNQCLPGGKPTRSDAAIKLTFHDGIHRNIRKTDENGEGQVGQVLPGLSVPPPRLAKKKKKKKDDEKRKVGKNHQERKKKQTGFCSKIL